MVGDIRITPYKLADYLLIEVFDDEGGTIVAGTIGYAEFMDVLLKGVHAPFDIIKMKGGNDNGETD